MDLELHLAGTLEQSAEGMARHLASLRDPFTPTIIALGDRSQELWLRHEVATRTGIAANWEVLGWSSALDAATRAVLGSEGVDPQRWWVPPPLSVDPWHPERMRAAVMDAFRKLADSPACGDLSQYLYGGKTPPPTAAWREISLAGEVSRSLQRLMRQRPQDAVRWAADPDVDAPSDASPSAPTWYRHVCRELRLDGDDTPSRRQLRVLSGGGRVVPGPQLVLFGRRDQSGTEDRLIEELARHLPIRWYRTVCSPDRVRQDTDEEPCSPIIRSLGLAEGVPASPSKAPPPRVDEVAPGWLGSIQASVREDSVIEPGALDTAAPSRTVEFHNGYSPLRQVEQLRDTLLRWFAEDRDHEPRDVLVVTPDLSTYAPLVQAVFARRGRSSSAQRLRQADERQDFTTAGTAAKEARREREAHVPTIPVAIANLGLTRTNPVAEVVLAALELCEERVTAPRLMALLTLAPVAMRYGLSQDDVADLRGLLVDSGMRWGLDGSDRQTVDQPDRHQNTVEFGLERLALGSLMAEEKLPDGIDTADLGPVMPMAVEGRDRTVRVARLTAVVRAIQAARARFRSPAHRHLGGWNRALQALMDDLAEVPDAAAWLRLQVIEVLDELLAGEDGESGPRIDLRTLRRLVAGQFELPARGDRVISGAVLVRQLALDVATPAKVVCFLGMDDQAFPRTHRPREWDPFRELAPGESDPRAIDRLAMLQALMAARQRVLVSWSGHELKRGRDLPPCVPVDELIGVLAEATGLRPDEVVQAHARHPWSPAELADGTYDRGLLTAASAVAQGITGGQRDTDRVLPEETHSVLDLPLETLTWDLANPSKLYLYGRLAVYLDEGQEEVPDREPLELDDLERWKLRREALSLLPDNETESDTDEIPDTLVRRLAGRGELPLQAGGRLTAEDAVTEARAIREKFAQADGSSLTEPPWTVALDCGVCVSGTAPHVTEKSGKLLLQWLVPGSTEGEKGLLRAWVHLLAARCCDDRVLAARIVGKQSGQGPKEIWLRAPTEGYEDRLNDLVTIWQAARNRPIPLFPSSSYAAAKKLAGKSPEERRDPRLVSQLVSEVRSKWHGNKWSRGDLTDRWVASLYGNADPADLATDHEPFGFLDMVERVWTPILEAKDRKLAGEWKKLGGSR